MEKSLKKEVAVFGGGCFWCTEAVFERIKGVLSVAPGYAGGQSENPSYEEVSSGKSGHAEVVQIVFDSNIVSYEDLLTVFFAVHDATSLNRQGNDAGIQYRSIILYASDQQKTAAEKFINKLEASGKKPIVTELKPLDKFYPAEDYHRHYYQKNPNKAYCQAVINPKLEKVEDKFKSLLHQ